MVRDCDKPRDGQRVRQNVAEWREEQEKEEKKEKKEAVAKDDSRQDFPEGSE